MRRDSGQHVRSPFFISSSHQAGHRGTRVVSFGAGLPSQAIPFLSRSSPRGSLGSDRNRACALAWLEKSEQSRYPALVLGAGFAWAAEAAVGAGAAGLAKAGARDGADGVGAAAGGDFR